MLAEKLGLAGKDGCGAFHLPATPNGRGVADAWAAADDGETREPGADRPAVRLRRRGRRRPERARARRARRARDRDRRCSRASRSAGPTSSCPARATSSATAATSTSRAACSACAARRSRPRRTSSPGSRGSRSASASTSRRTRRPSSRSSRSGCYDGMPFGEVGERAELRAHVPPAPVVEARGRSRRALRRRPAPPALPAALLGRGRRARPGARSSSAREPEVELAHDDAQRLGISTGDDVDRRLERHLAAPARAGDPRARRGRRPGRGAARRGPRRARGGAARCMRSGGSA